MADGGTKKEVTLQEVTAPGCQICKAFEEFWHSIENDWPNVKFHTSDVSTPEGQQLAMKYMILASPGIILNDELWATGGFDRKKFVEKLQELSTGGT